MAWGSFFSREPTPLLGLDIGTTGVRLVELSRQRSGLMVLERAAFLPLEPGSLMDGHIERFDELVDVVRRLVHASGSPTRAVAMALPASAVMARNMNLPRDLSDHERLEQAELEAAQFIPFPLDEVNLDVCETGQVAPSAGEVEVLIVAARQDAVFERQGVAEAAGLHVAIMDVVSFASRLAAQRVVKALFAPAERPLVALFELGSQSLGLQVLRGEAVLFERQQPLVGTPDALPQDMALALQFFFTSTPFNRVDHVLLAGTGWPDVTETVVQHTGATCRLINPFESMAVGPRCPSRPSVQEAPAYLRATGLALRRFYR
jgi:type IV pilus assembly protein PilM